MRGGSDLCGASAGGETALSHLVLGPEQLRALGEAFDSAWREIAGVTAGATVPGARHAIAESLLDAARAGGRLLHDELVRGAVVRAGLPVLATA